MAPKCIQTSRVVSLDLHALLSQLSGAARLDLSGVRRQTLGQLLRTGMHRVLRSTSEHDHAHPLIKIYTIYKSSWSHLITLWKLLWRKTLSLDLVSSDSLFVNMSHLRVVQEPVDVLFNRAPTHRVTTGHQWWMPQSPAEELQQFYTWQYCENSCLINSGSLKKK